MLRLLALAGGRVHEINASGMISVGGAQSSGMILPGLKHQDDYAVISPTEKQIALHPLKGKTKGPIFLKSQESLAIEDLVICTFDDSPSEARDDENDDLFLRDFAGLLKQFTEPTDLATAMQASLKLLVASTGTEKGLLIARNGTDDFDVAAQHGVNADEPWLSQTLIQETLKNQKPLRIQNIFGSGYDSNRSIVDTGFISVFTWPLEVRGETLGVALVGSQKPHSGLLEKESNRAATLAHLASLMLWFHLRDIKLKEEIAALKRQSFEDSPLLTSHGPLTETSQTAGRVAPTDLSVLIQGETGVGKELLATWVHRKSDRAQKPFVAVNCGAIPGELLESLLFGHKKGAFTGAHADQVGKFQLADGGTLFLDEIGDLPESLQVKLLRVLQEKTVEPLGGNRPQKVDVRIIAATHKPLSEMMSQGRFREDLYFRLAEIILVIPPLRERKDDIALLASAFLKNFSENKRFSTSAWHWLKSQEWRGNGRELSSAVKRAAVLSMGSEIEVADFLRGHQKAAANPMNDWLGAETLEEAKNLFIQEKVQQALARSGGQRNKAAELLGVTSRTLFRYLEQKHDNSVSLE